MLEVLEIGPAHVTCVRIDFMSYTILGGSWLVGRKGLASLPADCNLNMGGEESFADDLNGNGVL